MALLVLVKPVSSQPWANHLKFDIYDLQITPNLEDSSLRKLLSGVKNSSIIVWEDIDRVDMKAAKLSLSAILNCIDGLWSSCGEERIIIITTNHMERLDHALIRPGRMDLHVFMGYCSYEGFKPWL